MPMLFWACILLLLTATSLFVWVFYARHIRAGTLEDSSDKFLYEARLAEIDRDLKSSRIDKASAEIARDEAARLFIKSASVNQLSVPQISQANLPIMLGSVAFIPILSLAVYLSLGTPPKLNPISQNPPELAGQSIDQLLLAAEKRLETNPDDVRGWRVVAPVYMRQDKFEQAINAYQNVLRVEGPSSEIQTALGEALVARDDGVVTTEALALFQEAKTLEPRNATARFFIGLSAAQNDRLDEAKTVWQQMVDDANGDEEWLAVIKQRIADLEQDAQRPEIDKDAADAILDSTPGEQLEAIEGMVARLASRLDEDPSEKEGWVRLVRAYMVLGKPADAQAAVTKAKKAHPQDAALHTALEELIKTEPGQPLENSGGTQ